MTKKLNDQRNSILQSLAAQSEDIKKLTKTNETGDIADIASDAIDRALLDKLNEQDSNRLDMIDAALDRVRNGVYGICVDCGKEIPQARLKALPYAAMCVPCTNANS